jgi:hypothetical protein
MGPGRSRFWFPAVRLGAFVAVVVVAGALLFHAARPSVQADPGGLRRSDVFGRKKRKLERHWRSIERFFGDGEDAPPSRSRPSSDAGAGAQPVSWRVEPVEEVLPSIDSDLPALEWPGSFPSRPVHPIDLPAMETPFSGPALTPELAEEFLRSGRSSLLLDAGDALLRMPEALLDGLFSIGQSLRPRRGTQVLSDDEGGGSITSRILDFERESREKPLFTEFAERLFEREARFFMKFEDSELGTPEVGDGSADVDTEELLDQQRKILWDVARKTYLSKYRVRSEERIRDDAFYFNEWRGWDFAALPPLMAGYLWYRGLDKRISVGDSWLRVSFEPLSKWVSGHEELVAGASLEWQPKGFPVGLIVSAGLYDGDVELDFIGIGTSVGMARKALVIQRGED